jgi:hypothetical protein
VPVQAARPRRKPTPGTAADVRTTYLREPRRCSRCPATSCMGGCRRVGIKIGDVAGMAARYSARGDRRSRTDRGRVFRRRMLASSAVGGPAKAASALLAAACGETRPFEAVVVGEYERAFCGDQFHSTGRLQHPVCAMTLCSEVEPDAQAPDTGTSQTRPGRRQLAGVRTGSRRTRAHPVRQRSDPEVLGTATEEMAQSGTVIPAGAPQHATPLRFGQAPVDGAESV